MSERNIFLLAAGRGLRLNLEVPKVLAPLGGKPILDYTIYHLSELSPDNLVCVVGHQGELIQRRYGNGIIYRKQINLNGNAGAILAGIDMVPATSSCLVVQGDDSAFVSTQTYERVYRVHERSGAKITALLSRKYSPNTQHRYCQVVNNGRIIACHQIAGKKPEGGFFTGVYCFEPGFLRDSLQKLIPDSTGEISIPQLIQLALKESGNTVAVWDQLEEWQSINTREELFIANQRFSFSQT